MKIERVLDTVARLAMSFRNLAKIGKKNAVLVLPITWAMVQANIKNPRK